MALKKMGDDHFYIETIHQEYEGDYDPVFFDKSDFPWAADLEKSYPEIMECLAPIFENDSNYFLENPDSHLQAQRNTWRIRPFYANGIKIKKSLKKYPYLAQKLEGIPNLISACISMLEPGTKILPHNGNTNAIMRIHYPLKIPGQYPECGMWIEGHEISWKEGELSMFCNMKIHHVQNLTPYRRYILLMDVIRPEFVHLKKKVCIHVSARIATNALLNLARGLLGR
jgi:aspartyl/asparaginyl beta-hydroxylase (cupin superfamily)